MIHVIASIHFDPAKKEALTSIYREFVPLVLAEAGCIQYQPHMDMDTDLPNQDKDVSRFTVTEVWESYEAFQDHLNAPHVLEFRKSIQGIVENVTVRVLQPLLDNPD